ncbi:DUF4062 domain-containing protein [Brevibacillus laterosporus]|uniref:DUF4062 domain-containing protein n=1 Tax=Brevibacillus laterosporus TaxID=1465 RepID=UPI003D1931B4
MDKVKYQIFISSTYTDLVEVRKQVSDTILAMYHFPVGMELFSAGDEEQWEVIKDTLDVTDYYILIIGHRYGSMTDEGISYTEKEYDYAKELGIPILAFIRNRDVALRESEREFEAVKKEKLERFIEKAKGRMCQFWENQDDLLQKIAVALPKAFNRYERKGWVRGDKAASPETLMEMTRLLQENSHLKDELSKVKIKDIEPKLKVTLNEDNNIVIKYKEISIDKLKLPQKLDVDMYKSLGVSEDQVRKYNEELPLQEEIDKYNEEHEMYTRKKESAFDIDVKIENVGTSKANDLRVYISFPPEILVLKKEDLDALEEPNRPKIPVNPLDGKFITGYKTGSTHSLGLNHNLISRYITRSVYQRKIWIENNIIEIQIDDLLHSLMKNFDDIVIVPLKKGEFLADVSIICEETPKANEFSIPIKIE